MNLRVAGSITAQHKIVEARPIRYWQRVLAPVSKLGAYLANRRLDSDNLADNSLVLAAKAPTSPRKPKIGLSDD